MSQRPADPTPYEVLGVASDVSAAELKVAYRRALRRAHPDTGGSAAEFTAVQVAWERIGTQERRSNYDGGSGESYRSRFTSSGEARPTGTSAGGVPFGGASRPSGRSVKARSYGHPGGRSRELYLAALREWVGLGDPIPDPYDAALVRSAPRAVRRLLAEAVAEESTATLIGELGIGFTLWNDVAVDGELLKIDHVVLGPSGVYVLNSQDFGGSVELHRGELVGDAVGDERPLRSLTRASRALTRTTGVRFTAQLIVVPDDALASSYDLVPRGRGAGSGVVTHSALPTVLRNGVRPDVRVSIEDAFDVRSTLQDTLRLIR